MGAGMAELMGGAGTNVPREGILSRRAIALLSSAALVFASGPVLAQALPAGGSVSSGQAAISSPSPSSMVITQGSRTAIINWGSFSVGAGNSVRFENGAGATLNRVTGLSRSQINGMLSATGSVYLVNPNGITVGPGGQVSTGGSFVASTHDVSDAEFNAGRAMTFRGSSKASVINYGTIGALGGDVALIARKVENAGTITAPNGTVGLAAGYEVLMRDAARLRRQVRGEGRRRRYRGEDLRCHQGRRGRAEGQRRQRLCAGGQYAQPHQGYRHRQQGRTHLPDGWRGGHRHRHPEDGRAHRALGRTGEGRRDPRLRRKGCGLEQA
ncbi:MAG: hypothetical protein B7Y95_04980 [Rhizobiales bacterium 32-66-11]|nr:MAG: hypothetical protein B7Y95_04980 [Rhizobiales bacterium 32-66-11]